MEQCYPEKLTISQLSGLIANKRSEINALNEQLSIKKLELISLEALQRKISEVLPEQVWGEFLAFIEEKAPELAIILKKTELISIMPGKLLLKSRDIYSEILFYQKAVIEKFLLQHFDITFSVSINDDSKSTD